MDITPPASPDDNDFQNADSGGRPEAKRQAVADTRALKSYDLRIREGLTYKQIGDRLGITPSAAKAAYDRGRILLIPKQDVETAKEIALEKLDMWEQMAREIFDRKHVLVNFGKVVQGAEDFAPKLQALDRMIKIEAMRQKIVGYQAPSKRVLEVVSEDKFDEAIRELNAQAAELERQALAQTEQLAESILGEALNEAKLIERPDGD